MKNIQEDIKSGKKNYHFIEIMACPGGCVTGGGQPIVSAKCRMDINLKAERAKALYNEDINSTIRQSHKNADVDMLYKEFFGEPNSYKAHELLHTCPRCMNHKLLWKTYAGKMNNAYSYCITATTKEALVEYEEKPVKYMLQCTKCKRQFPRMKLTAVVQHPERYHCGCGGKIIRLF